MQLRIPEDIGRIIGTVACVRNRSFLPIFHLPRHIKDICAVPVTEIQVEFRCVVGKTRFSPSIRIPTNLCRTFYGTHLDAPLPPCRTPIAGYALGNTAVIFPVIQTAVRSRISRTSHDLRERSRISFVNSIKCTASQKQISHHTV